MTHNNTRTAAASERLRRLLTGGGEYTHTLACMDDAEGDCTCTADAAEGELVSAAEDVLQEHDELVALCERVAITTNVEGSGGASCQGEAMTDQETEKAGPSPLDFLPQSMRTRLTQERLACLSTIGDLRASLNMVLRMIALVPEGMLCGLVVDPYGVIGDSLRALGVSPEPDPWTALWRYCGLGEPGPATPEGAP